MRTRRSRAGDAPFWEVADLFRGRGAVWAPRDAGYELVRLARGDEKDWLVRLKLHVAPATREDDGRRAFRATVTWWPPRPRAQTDDKRTTAPGGWYALVTRVLRQVGYRGQWEHSPFGTFGNFSKDLRGPADVRREARLLETLELPAAEPAVTSKQRVPRRGRGTPRR